MRAAQKIVATTLTATGAGTLMFTGLLIVVLLQKAF